ncbi:MAG: hypothetical protein R3B13_05835 [Polyangiaceae bacterium]
MAYRNSLLLMLTLSLTSTLACGSDGGDGSDNGAGGDACSQAEQRYADCKQGSVLEINGACSGGNLDRANCINSASCAEVDQCILKTGSGGSGSGGATGSGGNPGSGGSAGTPGSGGTTGACVDISGTYSVAGSCDVKDCVVKQTSCTANFVCNNGTQSYTGAVVGSSVTFVGVTGTCTGTLAGNTLAGTCKDSLGLGAACQYSATR